MAHPAGVPKPVPHQVGKTTWSTPKPDEMSDVAEFRQAALRRRARERLSRIEEIRDAHALKVGGKSQREIADVLDTTQPRVHRMLKAAEFKGADAVRDESPEEVILRAVASAGDREDLVADLAAREYTFRTYAPDPSDGAVPGTWDQVKQAYLTGLLSKEEYERVRAAVRPRPS